MMKFWTDENFHGDMLSGLLAAYPDLNIVRVQDTEFSGAPDSKLLEAAAKNQMILITHDVHTMTKYAYERIKAGLPMPGVIEVAHDAPIGQAVADLILLIGASMPDEFENQVKYIPRRHAH